MLVPLTKEDLWNVDVNVGINASGRSNTHQRALIEEFTGAEKLQPCLTPMKSASTVSDTKIQ